MEGWPLTDASLVFKDRVSAYDGTMTARLKRAGAVLVGQTTASEFGGINCTYTRLHGATSNPYDLERTPGGSSGGSAAAVAGGLFPICTGGDGGGSIRIPAGFTGLFGLKATFGRIPKGPYTEIEPLTAVLGCLARSVRDTGAVVRRLQRVRRVRPVLPSPGRGLGVRARPAGRPGEAGRGVRRPRGGGRRRTPCARRSRRRPRLLIEDAGLERHDVPIALPQGGMEWAMAGTASLLVGLGDLYPACEPELTPEIMLAANIATHHFDMEARRRASRRLRRASIVQMARDLRAGGLRHLRRPTPTSPSAPRDRCRPRSTGWTSWPSTASRRRSANNGALTIPANTTGHPAVAIPVGLVDGLPGLHADHRAAARRAAPARPGPDRRAGAAMAPRGTGGPDLTRICSVRSSEYEPR